MTLFMLQFEPDMPRLIRWAKSHGVLPRDADDDFGYSLHAVFAACFGSFAPKPFMFQPHPGAPKILAYSALDAGALRAHALDFALPDAIAAINLDNLLSKPMPAAYAVGRDLGFSVRVRPTVRTDKDGNRERTREIDAFEAAIVGTAEDAGTLRAQVYSDWLTLRMAQGGCAIRTPLTLSGLRRTAVFRRDQNRGLRRIGGKDGGPDATFTGILRVTEPEAFSDLLARGVGRHRAFGFGMLLLRPA
jgi:CRISPR system Cascade subunit CasE